MDDDFKYLDFTSDGRIVIMVGELLLCHIIRKVVVVVIENKVLTKFFSLVGWL